MNKNVIRSPMGSSILWEELAGYTPAVRIGDRILVSGTTAAGPSGVVGKDDPAHQTAIILDKIEVAIRQLGGSLSDVVRTRIYVRHIDDAKTVAIVHAERFGDIRPVSTLVQARLIDDDYLVEIEAEAVLAGD